MEQGTIHQRSERTPRRAFLKQVLALGGVSAGTALLNACGSSNNTTTAPTTAASATTAAQPGPSSDAAAATEAATTGAASTATSEATAAATTQATAAATSATTTAATVGQSATPAIVAAANAFLATLDDSQKSSVLFDFSNTEQKQRWSNLPQGLFERAGLRMGDLSEEQQNASLAVLQAILSTEGYNRVIAEWNADEALTSSSGGSGGPAGRQLLFGKQYYWVAVIGTPSETDPWQYQWGGHHVTVNATIVGSNISLTPSFIGVQPGEYTDANGNTVRPLGDIDDEAFALINSLDATQQAAAVLGNTVIDLVLGPGQDGKTIQSEGLQASQMNADQQTAFLKLIAHYTGLANDAAAAARLAEVQSTLDQTYLAWYGPTTSGSSAYFRVTGPTIVVEYSPQGGGGNGTGLGGTATKLHIHGIYRDPTNDYGEKYV